jgi:4-hydroxythreonine-4-phosphate dehydrogenase
MNLSHEKPKRIAITMGDVMGVGPEILVKALKRDAIQGLADYVIYGDAAVFERALGVFAHSLPTLPVIRDAGHPAPPVQPGVLSREAGACAHAWIAAATLAVQRGEADALVTCPVNKEAMLLAGHRDLGHTELLSRLLDAHDWRMCLFTRGKLVVHLTGHLSLREALDAITPERVLESVRMAHEALKRAGIATPRIAVAGINPHAGEHGIIGTEDEDLLRAPVAFAQSEGINCSGPHPPDAVFRALWEGRCDGVIAMYHDQGHIAMKMVAMDEGVSLTLGLPIVRTSPDHGTAFDIAWKGIAREDSLCEAIKLAVALAETKR